MNLKKEIDSNKVLLVLMPGVDYNKDIIRVMKEISGKNICYVTLNKTFDSLKESFKKARIKIDNVVFIDAISKTIKEVPAQTEGCYFISSPAAMTEISIAIDKFLRHNFDYIIFDSLTNLLVYESKAPVARFVASLVNKIKQSKTKGIFYALSVKEQEAMIKEAGMFVDKVVSL